jgi:hypothetical protein
VELTLDQVEGVEYEAAVLTVQPTGALAVADGVPDGPSEAVPRLTGRPHQRFRPART